MAISPKCTICKKELTKFGGILLSPLKRDTVKKFHICADCYKEIVEKKFTITQNKKHLKKSLKTGALERASRNKALSGEWFNLEEESWSKKKRK